MVKTISLAIRTNAIKGGNKMNDFKKSQLILKIVLIIAIVGGIALGIATEDKQKDEPDTTYEKVFKLSAFFLVVLTLVFYWVLPNTKMANHLKMNEPLFVITNVLGMICGIIGLVATFLWQELIVETHLFEVIVILFGCVYVYWAMIMKRKKTVEISDILDEKQIDDMTKAAAFTLTLSTCVMLIVYLHNLVALEGKTWFLFYFFIVLLVYSASTLYYFKKV